MFIGMMNYRNYWQISFVIVALLNNEVSINNDGWMTIIFYHSSRLLYPSFQKRTIFFNDDEGVSWCRSEYPHFCYFWLRLVFF